MHQGRMRPLGVRQPRFLRALLSQQLSQLHELMSGTYTMRAGVLLDQDGTIIVDYHYVGHVERVQFIPGAIDAIRRFNQAHIPVFILTNKGGVARGFFSEADVYTINDYINAELALHGARVDGFYYSPHHPDGTVTPYARESYDHKPNPGMALHAAEDHDLDLTRSVVVGDRMTDV